MKGLLHIVAAAILVVTGSTGVLLPLVYLTAFDLVGKLTCPVVHTTDGTDTGKVAAEW
jgi:hypothetical protein